MATISIAAMAGGRWYSAAIVVPGKSRRLVSWRQSRAAWAGGLAPGLARVGALRRGSLDGLAALTLVLAGSSCSTSSSPGALDAPCEHAGDCQAGLTCRGGVCSAPLVDASGDAGPPEASADAAAAEAGAEAGARD